MRKARVESFFKREIALILNQELGDPRLGMVTVTQVEMSNDLKMAVVYLSLPDDAAKKMKIVEGAKGYVKKLLASRVSMKFMPDIAFRIDRSLEEGEHIDQLLDEIKKHSSGE